MLLLKLFLIVALCRVSVQQSDEEEGLSLTRETVDALLQVLTPNCRSELEGALESQAEISDDCKIEIQAAVPQFISPEDQEKHQMQQQEYERRQRGEGGGKQKRRKSRGSEYMDSTESEGYSPNFIIGSLISIVIAGIVGVVMYLQSSSTDDIDTNKKQTKTVKKKIQVEIKKAKNGRK